MIIDAPRGGTPPLITEPAGLAATLDELAGGTGPFALDTERAHAFRYSERAYLIQIKRTGGGLHLIDPVALGEEMTEVARVLATDEWILHAADQDLPSLRREGLSAPALFDTEIAAMLLGDERLSLQAVLEENVGVTLAKEHSNSDWSRRPLAPELLAYAALDVEYLIDARSVLARRLEEAGRTRWMIEECEHVLATPDKTPAPDPWRKIVHRAGAKDRRTLAVVRELWDTRDRLARERDLAPSKILPNKALAAFVASLPSSRAETKKHRLMTEGRARYADALWEAIERGQNTDDPPPLHRPATAEIPAPREWERHHPQAARRWKELRPAVLRRADEIGIRQDVLVKPSVQREAAWRGWSTLTEAVHVLTNAGARPWQIEELAPVLPRSLR